MSPLSDNPSLSGNVTMSRRLPPHIRGRGWGNDQCLQGEVGCQNMQARIRLLYSMAELAPEDGPWMALVRACRVQPHTVLDVFDAARRQRQVFQGFAKC